MGPHKGALMEQYNIILPIYYLPFDGPVATVDRTVITPAGCSIFQ